VPRLAKLLEDYERRREAYPTLEDFYPKLLDGFRAGLTGDDANPPRDEPRRAPE
jgi:hypothetical protein